VPVSEHEADDSEQAAWRSARGNDSGDPVPATDEQPGSRWSERSTRPDADGLRSDMPQTVESLLREVERLRRELARLEAEHVSLRERLTQAQRRTPEEILGEVLIAAHQAAETMLEQARYEASQAASEARQAVTPLLDAAQRALTDASRLQEEVRAALQQAERDADTMREKAEAERHRVLEDALSGARKRRDELDAENARIERAIGDFRAEWTRLAIDALAGLDKLGLESDRLASEPGEPDLGLALGLRLPASVDRADPEPETGASARP
jgi:cell division septum initiation protein DivIVA